MAIWKKTSLLILLALASTALFAQGERPSIDAMERQRAADTFKRKAQIQQRIAEAEVRKVEQRQRVAEVQMREAEERLAEAARQIAELSRRTLPEIADIERYVHAGGRVMLGITIAGEDDDGPVEGVMVRGVSPNGAAEEAGLRSGDIITAINGESLTADNSEDANAKLIDFMSGVEEGDVLDIEYLRNGKQESVEVRPEKTSSFAFAFRGVPGYSQRVAPDAPTFSWDFRYSDGSGWGHMELVMLTERLGSYFGTDEGLLVVRAPDDDTLKLQDGDVIQSIDGREPKSVSHAMRILGSYQGGEELELQIMRDKRKQTLKIEMPDNRRSSLWRRVTPGVESDVVVVPKVRVLKEERT